MINLLEYDFIVRGLLAGIAIAFIAPVVGIFLVLRRYSLIADTLSHVSLAGIAAGFLLNINPVLSAIGATTLSSILIEKLRLSKRVYGESALALFLSGSLALAVILISLSNGFNSTLFNYLFGSIGTVTRSDVFLVIVLTIAVLGVILLLFKKLLFITFDEDMAKIDGINVYYINTVFIILAAITISISIPIIGVLLISALLIIPVLTALQLKKSFVPTIIIAQFLSIISVVLGIIISFYFNLAPGGTIVLINLAFFLLISFYER